LKVFFVNWVWLFLLVRGALLTIRCLSYFKEVLRGVNSRLD